MANASVMQDTIEAAGMAASEMVSHPPPAGTVVQLLRSLPAWTLGPPAPGLDYRFPHPLERHPLSSAQDIVEGKER